MSTYVFTCHICHSDSGYSIKKPGDIVLEFKPSMAGSEKRIYKCECCGAENEIENTPKEWEQIDNP